METAQLFAKPSKIEYFETISMIDYISHLTSSGSKYTKVNHFDGDELVYHSIIPDIRTNPIRYFYPDGEQFKKP